MSDAAITLLDDWASGQRCPVAKRRIWARKVERVDTVLVHATAVKGGFGVTGRQMVAEQQRAGYDPERDSSAIMARLTRYRGTPYHGIYSPRGRFSVVQWAATQHTYHGDAANKCSVGWAYDGLFTPAHSDDLDVEGARASLRHLIKQAREQGCPLRRLAPHANHAPPPRHAKPHDPGPRVWLEVVVAVAGDEGLELAADWVTGGAEPWAKRWMEVAA